MIPVIVSYVWIFLPTLLISALLIISVEMSSAWVVYVAEMVAPGKDWVHLQPTQEKLQCKYTEQGQQKGATLTNGPRQDEGL